MPKRAFGYAGTKTGLLRRRVSGCMEEAFGCLESNLNAHENIRILKGDVHGGYPDAKKCIRILFKLSRY